VAHGNPLDSQKLESALVETDQIDEAEQVARYWHERMLKETGCKEAEHLHSNEELQAEVEDCWAMEDMDG